MARQQVPPADVLFGKNGRTEPADEPRRKHVAVTVYMPPEMVADLDDMRALLRRNVGKPVDRGRLVRECISMCTRDYADTLVERFEEEA